MSVLIADLFDLQSRQTHGETTIVAEHPLEVVTPAVQWSYAVSTMSRQDAPPFDADARIALTVRMRVAAGCIGVGWTLPRSDAFVVERYFSKGDHGLVVRVPSSALPGRLMFRNVSPDGASHFVLHGVEARLEARPPYPVALMHRSAVDSIPAPIEQRVFDGDLAVSINRARLDFLAGLELELAGRRVLDAGCGIGHHTPFYAAKGCTVVGIDGRPENISEMRRLYPNVEGVVGDVQHMDLQRLGAFDIVHCFGLLYHLDSPVAALQRLASVCREYLFLETMVCDARDAVMILADEPSRANQALGGVGCRPSPSFVALALDRVGFPHVYGSTRPPAHPDFLFDWRNNLDIMRGGNNLRCMFVASRTPIQRESLVELVPS